MTGRRFSDGSGRRRASRTKKIVGASIAAAGLLIVGIAVSGAYSGAGGGVSVHNVDDSPQDIREVWPPERLEDAELSNPMPGITKD
ncbi:hypothetical protein KBX06_02280 [Micromonospora sp. C31]|uniref:hypothetical protein n=1 Tax=Micromonospora sp. C31 TaxID=2824876 RepID=UPI001B364EB8|nr:hypothetical protein [Micromonospora sp. C31]MBQ1071999.1 hypothetical protein [Micromonospora sp. C31]